MEHFLSFVWQAHILAKKDLFSRTVGEDWGRELKSRGAMLGVDLSKDEHSLLQAHKADSLSKTAMLSGPGLRKRQRWRFQISFFNTVCENLLQLGAKIGPQCLGNAVRIIQNICLLDSVLWLSKCRIFFFEFVAVLCTHSRLEMKSLKVDKIHPLAINVSTKSHSSPSLKLHPCGPNWRTSCVIFSTLLSLKPPMCNRKSVDLWKAVPKKKGFITRCDSMIFIPYWTQICISPRD